MGPRPARPALRVRRLGRPARRRSRPTLVVVESDRDVEPPPGWGVVRERRYGSTLVAVLRLDVIPRSPDRHLTSGVTVALVLYPGSFDPIHNGHLEIIETASRLFDERRRGGHAQPAEGRAAVHPRRARGDDRGVASRHLDNVEVTMFSSLVVDLAREVGADFIVKGLRAVSDFETELQMAQMNHKVSGVDTLFIPSASANSFLASKYIREIARFGGDVSAMVPAAGGQAPRGEVPQRERFRRDDLDELSDLSAAPRSRPPYHQRRDRGDPAASCATSSTRPGRCRCRPRR